MAYVGKITDTDGVTGLVGSTLYGTCATAASTVAKVVTLADFDELMTGVTIHVKFTNSNTAANPTLNVNSTGAKSIYKYGTTVPGTAADTSWPAGSVVSFTYDGSAWIMNDHIDNTNTDTKVTQNVSSEDKKFPVLLSYYENTDNTTTAQTVNRVDTIYANPNSGYLWTKALQSPTWGIAPTSSAPSSASFTLSDTGLYFRSRYLSEDGNAYDYSRPVLRTYKGKHNNSGMVISLDSGGLTIVGGGESATSLAGLISDDQHSTSTAPTTLDVGGTLGTTFNGSSEQLILSADNNIYFITKCNTIAQRQPVVLDTNSYFYPGTTNTGSIGTSSYKWGSIYATNINGKLYTTATNPSSETLYYVPFISGATSGNYDQLVNDGFGYRSREGSESQDGFGAGIFGNSTASGTVGNKYGVVRIYGTGAYYSQIKTNAGSSNKTVTIPNMAGNFLILNKNSTSYWGLYDGDASMSNWIRTTTNGFLPVEAGGLDNPHSSLGTSSWAFNNAYIANIYTNKIFPGSGVYYNNASGFASAPWAKTIDFKCTGESVTRWYAFRVYQGYEGTTVSSGLLIVTVVTTANKVYSSGKATWVYAAGSLDKDNIVVTYTDVASTSTTIAIWAKCTKRYQSWHVIPLYGGWGSGKGDIGVNCYSTTTGEAAYTGTLITSSYADIKNNAASADKLNTNAGSTKQPVYFTGGVPTAIGYTIEKNVPSNAVFTDHITTASTSGSGNAVTAISADANGALTVTKGTTFLTSSTQYISSITSSGSGNAVTALSVSNGVLTYTKGSTFLTQHPTIPVSTDTTSTASPAFGGTFTAVDSVTRDSNGHVTKINTKTVTVPGTTMGAATADNAGTKGLVPAPGAGKQASFLRGDGTWVVPTNTDTKVTQTAIGSTYTNYRPLVISAANNATAGFSPSTVTDSTFITAGIYCQPSTGKIFAKEFDALNASNTVTATLHSGGLWLKSYIEGANATYNYNETVLKTYAGKLKSNNGMLITLQGGGLTIVGGGESATSLANLIDDDQSTDTTETPTAKLNVGGALGTNLVGDNEHLILSSDNNIYFITTCQTIANRKPVVLDTSSYFYPGTNETGSIGTSSYKWGNGYFKTINIGTANITTLNATKSNGIAKVGYVAFPEDGTLLYNEGGSSVTGAIVITTPFSKTIHSVMLKFTVDIYDYQSNKSIEYKVSGYAYTDGKWYCVTAHNVAAPLYGQQGTDSSETGYEDLAVRFGYVTDGNYQIQIGETTTVWKWPNIVIRDIMVGHVRATEADIPNVKSGWSIAIQSSGDIANVTQTISHTRPYYPTTTVSGSVDADTYLKYDGIIRWNTTTGTNMPTTNYGLLICKAGPAVQVFIPDNASGMYFRRKASTSGATPTAWWGFTGTAGNTYNLDNFITSYTDENVKNTLIGSTANATYMATFVPTAGVTSGVNVASEIRFGHTPASGTTAGNARLILGNNKSAGATDKKVGLLRIYSVGTGYHTLSGAQSNSNFEHTFPTKTGTVINSGCVGTGLTWDSTNNALNHSNSITAGTVGDQSAATLTWGGTFKVPKVVYDAQGHIKTGTTDITFTMPANPNSDAKVKQSTSGATGFRPIVLGYTNSSTVSDLDATVTNQVYVTTTLYTQPSTGKLFIGYSTQSSYPTGGIHVHDVRNVDVTPDVAAEKSANFYFHQYTLDGTNNYWWGVLNVRPWTGGYSSWEIAGPSHNVDQRTTPLYVRTSNKNTAWGNWRKIYDTANKPTAADVGAVPNTKAGMNAAIDLLDTGADSVEMTDSTTFISHDINASTVAYLKRNNIVMYNYIYKKLQHNNAMDVSHTFAHWNTVGWHRCFSMPCSATSSGRIIRTLEIAVYRNYNNGQPEYFKVRLAGLYNATESFDVLYQKSNTAATQYITKIRMVKSADSKTLYVDLYYNSTNSNENTMYVKWYDPNNSLNGSEKITWSSDADAQAVQDDSLTVVATLDIPWNVGDGYSKGSSDHWGVMFPGGSTSGWLRTSSSGLLPNTSGNLTRTSGGSLGASGWAFVNGYIKNIYSVKLNVYNSAATYKHEISSIASANRTVTLPDTNCTVGTGLFYVIGTQTAATSAWTGVLPLPALYDGLTIAYYLPYASGSDSVTLELTLSNGTTSGPKEVRYTNNSRFTNAYGAGSCIILTYFSASSVKVAGADTVDSWRRCDYNTNTNTMVNVTLNTTSKAYLLATTSTPTSTATARTAVADTGVYLDTTAGMLTATSFRANNNIKIYDANNTSSYTQIKYQSTLTGSVTQYFPTVDGEIQVSQGQLLLYNGTVSLTSSTQLTISGGGELSDYRLLMMEFWAPGSGYSHHIVVPWQYVRSQSSGTYVWFQSLPVGQSSDATSTNHNNCMGILSDSGGSSYSSKIVLKPGGNFTGSWLIRVYALI